MALKILFSAGVHIYPDSPAALLENLSLFRTCMGMFSNVRDQSPDDTTNKDTYPRHIPLCRRAAAEAGGNMRV